LVQTLTDLIIEGFDEEQVWAGVELQNGSQLARWADRRPLAASLEEGSLLLGGPLKRAARHKQEEMVAGPQAHSDNEPSESEGS
jgi:hypothetical protein